MKPFIVTLIVFFSTTNQAAQTCTDAILPTAPDDRYKVNTNVGTVTDTRTDLVWKQCSEGSSGSNCSGSATTYTWQDALQTPAVLNAGAGYAGFRDWRLPNIKELASLIERQCVAPSINLTIFPGTLSSNYWSASPYANNPSNAWNVYFYHGDDLYYNRSTHAYVRLVRGG